MGGRIVIGINDLTSGSYNSVNDENTNADVTIIEIVFRKNGYVRERISGTGLSFQAGFNYDTWQDDNGNIWPRGQVNRDAGGWQMHENAWVSISTSLPAGDYEVEWRLGTTLFENNVNDEMVVQTTITASENIDKTQSMQLLRAELQSLYLNATNRPLSEQATDNVLDLMLEHARIAAERSYRTSSSGQCDLWNLGNSRQGEGRTSDYDSDPAGMMRAWTMVLHSVMTSFGYLHD